MAAAYLHPVHDMELALVIHEANVSSPKPPILGLGLLRCLWVTPVTLHDILRPHPQLTPFVAFEDFGDSILSHDLGLTVGVELADRGREALLSRVPAENGARCSEYLMVSIC